MELIIELERSILLFFQSIRSAPMDKIMIFITTLGDSGLLWILVSIGLIFNKKFRRVGIISLLSLLLCFVLNNIVIKNIIQRPRPFYSIQDLRILISIPSEFSFPSGHSSSSFAAATGMFLASKKKVFYLFYILAFFIAISRVYVGVHYLSDVLVGAFVGILCGVMVNKLFLKYIPEK